MSWPRTSSTNFYKTTENPNSNTKIQDLDYRLPGRYALDKPNNRRPGHCKDILILLLQQLGFIIKLKKSVLLVTQKLVFLDLEIGSVNMTLTLPMEKVKSVTQKRRNLIENPKPTL